jgi:hypothetical protein
MNETVLVAIIGGLCTAIPTVISTILVNNKNQAVFSAKVEANNKFINYQIDELKAQVEKHNGIVERTYHLEEQVHVLKSKMEMYHNE